MLMKFVLYKIAPIDVNKTLWNNKGPTYYVCISEYGSKNGSEGISVAREPK